MVHAKPGQRVADRHSNHGTIISLVRNIAYVQWDDGLRTQVHTSEIYKIGGPRWGLYAAIALSLGLIIALSVWLL